ncbi:MAG: hypothetical protein AB1430_14070 [Pseudomonadota bacterium]
MNTKTMKTWTALAGAAAALAALLAGCGSGASSDEDTVTVNGDVPIAYAKRVNTLGMNPTDGTPSAPGGDLIIREKSSPSAAEHNVTARFTQGQGDVSDPEVSYDGKKVVFAMRCPTSNTSTIDGQPACTGRWNIWEYDTSTGGLANGSFRRLTSSSTADDVDPYYLPAGRGFVFSSNRQGSSSTKQINGRTYFALDEYERERVLNLHTMAADGSNIQQISVNQSHDRNPVVRPNGDIMFSRWDHVGGRNHFKIFRVKPDGTDMFVLYGAHSPGNSFLHPRDMDPTGPYAGQVSSSLMPLSGTREGGALVFVDVTNYSEQDTPANARVAAQGGQMQPENPEQQLSFGRELSRFGRVTTPFPLWDGTHRVLVSYEPCQVRRTADNAVVSCAELSNDQLALLNDRERMVAETDEFVADVPPSYGIYMFDPTEPDPQKRTMRIIAAPPPGFIYTDPVPLMARPEPNATEPTAVDATLAAQGKGLLEVRSVYDTDGLGRMGDPVITAADLAPGCTTALPKVAPTDPEDTRAQVADLVRMKSPTDAAYNCAPARFIRVMRAVAPPSGMTGLRDAIGETEFEMQQILGYAPIEPDGSFKIEVPADTPIGLAVVDSQGRAFQTHTNWIQVRPGERRTCDGCHSPRRGGALNSGAVVNTVPAGLRAAMASAHQSGETMAATRTRIDPNALQLAADLFYQDVWADTTQAGVTARPTIDISYAGLGTTAPQNGIINYPDHIQPLWTRDRGANTCTNCHNDPVKLDLRAQVGGTGRLVSYDELLIGDPVIDATTGRPVTRIREGVPEIERGPALVDTSASEGEAAGLTRKSRLGEILFGQDLMAGAAARTAHPNPPGTAPNHATLLNAAEKRLIAEWMDLGGQYYNDPFNANNTVRTVNGLSETTFTAQVLPILRSTCASCHQPVGSSNDGRPALTTSFRNNRFVLTGSAEGDYNVTLSMISDVCNLASNRLISQPSTVPHPAGSTATTAVLPAGSANYNTIASWISSGCQ